MRTCSNVSFFRVCAFVFFGNARGTILLWQLCVFILIATVLPVRAATVTWVGPSGDWSATANWSTGSLPGPSDEVVIPAGASITVTHSTGTDAVNSIVCNQPFNLSGGSLSVANTFQIDTNLDLTGGKLLEATVVTTNGGSLVVSSGTLDGVTLDVTVDVGNSVSGANLIVTNYLELNGTRLVEEVSPAATSGRSPLRVAKCLL